MTPEEEAKLKEVFAQIEDEYEKQFGRPRPRDKFILNDQKVAIPVNFGEWAIWFEKAGQDRIVKQEVVGEWFVSTVFLGIDHSFGLSPARKLFETMVFVNERTVKSNFSKKKYRADQYQERYSTWPQAEKGHDAIVAKLKAGTLFEDAKGM